MPGVIAMAPLHESLASAAGAAPKSRATNEAGTPLIPPKFPPRIIFPSDCTDIVVGPDHAVLKARVQTAVGIESRDPVACHFVDRIKAPSNHYLAVGLQRHRSDSKPGPEHLVLKAFIQTAVGIEPRDTGAAHAVDS